MRSFPSEAYERKRAMNIISNQKNLNKQQREAIQHGSGPLLIIAGAGTGKTTVLTERIKYLILQKKVPPHEILALTFTEKAALEMQNRVDEILPLGYSDIWITTFHAFGERVLRSEALQLGLNPGYQLISTAQAIIFLRKHLFEFDLAYFRPLGNPNKFIQGLLGHFSRLKDEDITAADYLKWAEAQNSKVKVQKISDEEKIEIDKYNELAKAYQTYEELKAKEGVMDFSDLISNTLLLFRKRKNICKIYQRKFKYILIDEFQDTNFAQNELAKLLAADDQNITVVGDDDQAIYRWRGAALSNIIQFRKHYRKSKVIVLKENYRSTQKILDESYKLIQNNNPDRLEVKEKIDKRLVNSEKTGGEKIELLFEQRVEDEAFAIAKKIKEIQKETKNKNGDAKYSWKDFAILVRANIHAIPLMQALSRYAIPYQLSGPGQLFRQTEIKDLIAYLQVLQSNDNSVALFRVLSMDIFSIVPIDIVRLNTFAQRTNLSLFDALDVVVGQTNKMQGHWSVGKNYEKNLPHISETAFQIFESVYTMIVRHMGLAQKETAGQILYYFLQDSGLLLKMADAKNEKDEKRILNISKFFEKLKSFELLNKDATVLAVLDWIDMALELGESPSLDKDDMQSIDAVHILTIHASKGLEFGIVFLTNLVSGRFPSRERSEQIPVPDELIKEILPEGDFHIEEERRLFYVGMTRAKDRLFFTAASLYGEGKRERKLSPFVYEVLGKDVIGKPSQLSNQLSLLEWKKETIPEEIVKRQQVGYLSYSQIQSFITCPLQYKYRYIMRIPVPASAAGSFGTSVHAALQHFYERVQKKEAVNLEILLELFEKNWIPLGYTSKAHAQKMKERGKKMLQAYFENAFNPSATIDSLEKLFSLRITPTLKVGGKIDRVDLLPDGKIEIIDYKTGKKPTQKEIAENLQMTVYALAATNEGILNKKPEDVILSFYFLEPMEKISSQRSKDQLEKAQEKLKSIASEIETSEFPPKVGPWCDFCDFRLICEAWQ